MLSESVTKKRHVVSKCDQRVLKNHNKFLLLLSATIVVSKCDQETTCEQCRLQVRPMSSRLKCRLILGRTLRRHYVVSHVVSPTINCQKQLLEKYPWKMIGEIGFDD